jgi:hypothetical protein
MLKRKMTKEQTMIYNILHRKLKIKQYKPDYKPGLNSGAPERLAVPAPLVCIYFRGSFRLIMV